MLVSVLQTRLGKKQQFFCSDEKCCQTYYWMGSLSAKPEFFHLHYKRSSTAIERTIFTISEVTESNLTINVIDQRSFFKNEGYIVRDKSPSSSYSSSSGSQNLADDEVIVLDDSASHSFMTNGLICPICNKRYPGNAVENHTGHCAESTFFELDDMNDEDTDIVFSKSIFKDQVKLYTRESSSKD